MMQKEEDGLDMAAVAEEERRRRRRCELCAAGEAAVHCESDEARLCWACDARVHAANFLVARHSRALLCRCCRRPTPWRATGPSLTPILSLCVRCCARHARPPPPQPQKGGGAVAREAEEEDRTEGIGAEEDEENADGEEDDWEEEIDDDEEEEEGENQVVPWSTSSSAVSPDASSSSSSTDESSSDRVPNSKLRSFKRLRDIGASQDDRPTSSEPSLLTMALEPPSSARNASGDQATSFGAHIRPSKRVAVHVLRPASSIRLVDSTSASAGDGVDVGGDGHS